MNDPSRAHKSGQVSGHPISRFRELAFTRGKTSVPRSQSGCPIFAALFAAKVGIERSETAFLRPAQTSGSPLSGFWNQPGCPIHAVSSHEWASRVSATAFFLPITPQTRSQSDVPAVNQILPEGEAILLPPMDNTPNNTPEDPPTRIPNLGHALLFLAIAGLLLILTQLSFLPLTHATLNTVKAAVPPKLLIASEAATYLATIAISWFFFPLLWKRPFAEGIHLNPDAVRRNALKLIPIGIALSLLVQAASSLATLPKNIPIDDFFRTPSDVWLIAIFGTLLAPLFEEIGFRGFLLPAFAIAYDWLALPRTDAARDLWNSSNKISGAGYAFSAVLTSILFAAVHGQQVGYAWPVLLLLFCVSLILSVVRLHLRSVLASTLIHASYNFTIFLTAFIATDGYRHLDKMAR